MEPLDTSFDGGTRLSYTRTYNSLVVDSDRDGQRLGVTVPTVTDMVPLSSGGHPNDNLVCVEVTFPPTLFPVTGIHKSVRIPVFCISDVVSD